MYVTDIFNHGYSGAENNPGQRRYNYSKTAPKGGSDVKIRGV